MSKQMILRNNMKFFVYVVGLFLFSIFMPIKAVAEFPLAYVGSSDILDVSLAPSGAEVCVLTKKYKYEGGVRTWDGIDILDIETGRTRVTHQIKNYAYYWVNWVNEDMIVAYATKFYTKKKKASAQNVIIAINPDTGKYRELFATKKVKKSAELGRLEIVSFSGKLNEVVFTLFEHKKTKLVAVDLESGESTVLDEGSKDTITWFVDKNHQPYVRMDTSGHDHILKYKQRDEDGKWVTFQTVNRLEKSFDVVRYRHDGLRASVLTRPEHALRTGLYDLELRSGEYSKPVFEHSEFDLTEVKYSTFENDLLYAGWWEDTFKKHWFQQDHEASAKALEAKLGKSDNWYFRESSRSMKTWLIYVSSVKNPGTYMVWDSVSKNLTTVGKNRPGLSPGVLSERIRIDYLARDGLKLSGYLTPSLKIQTTSPLVVIPHGGPVTRDYLDWDGWAQFLAFRGFNVFQPNFRGSGGFGKEFEELGHLEWGRKMQTDIEDGVHYLEARNLIPSDTKRAIVGASYGGYAALMAAVATPKRYQCVTSINGVTDPISFIEGYDESNPLEKHVKDVWIRRIGDPDTNLDALKTISPLHNLDKISARLYVSHGTHDLIVPFSQSEMFYKEALKAGVRIRFKQLVGAGHNRWGDSRNTEVLTGINIFLLQCM